MYLLYGPVPATELISEVCYMPRLHQEFDADRIAERPATQHPSNANRFEIACGICGRTAYVDEESKREFDRAMEFEADNKFTCSQCEQEYDEIAYR